MDRESRRAELHQVCVRGAHREPCQVAAVFTDKDHSRSTTEMPGALILLGPAGMENARPACAL